MPLELAQAFVVSFELYALVGVVCAVLVVPRVIVRLDPRVAGSSKVMRLLIVPGVAAFWPLFAWRWMAGAAVPVERNPHRTKAGAR